MVRLVVLLVLVMLVHVRDTRDPPGVAVSSGEVVLPIRALKARPLGVDAVAVGMVGGDIRAHFSTRRAGDATAVHAAAAETAAAAAAATAAAAAAPPATATAIPAPQLAPDGV